MDQTTQTPPTRRFGFEIIRQPLRSLEIAGCVILSVVFVYYLISAMALPPPYNAMDIGAGGFPKLIAGATLTAIVAVAALAVVRALARVPSEVVAIKRPVMVLAGIVALLLEALAFTHLGALATIGLFSLLTMLICGERRIAHLIGSPLALVGFVYLIFVLAFGVRLP